MNKYDLTDPEVKYLKNILHDLKINRLSMSLFKPGPFNDYVTGPIKSCIEHREVNILIETGKWLMRGLT